MGTIKINIKRITETNFSINKEIMDDASKPLDARMGFELLSDINKNLLTIATQIAYITPNSEIGAVLSFNYTLEVISLKDLQYVSNPSKGTHDYKFPNGFIEAVLTDVYATGRVLMASHLKDTRLEGSYLPFGGAGNLIKLMKKK